MTKGDLIETVSKKAQEEEGKPARLTLKSIFELNTYFPIISIILEMKRQEKSTALHSIFAPRRLEFKVLSVPKTF